MPTRLRGVSKISILSYKGNKWITKHTTITNIRKKKEKEYIEDVEWDYWLFWNMREMLRSTENINSLKKDWFSGIEGRMEKSQAGDCCVSSCFSDLIELLWFFKNSE